MYAAAQTIHIRMKTYQLFISEVRQALASIEEKQFSPKLGHYEKFLGHVIIKGIWAYGVWFGNIKGDPDARHILVLDEQNDNALAATIVLAPSIKGNTFKYTVVSFKVEPAYNKKQSEFALPIILKISKSSLEITQ